MKAYQTLDDVDVEGKRVLLRADLNVPLQAGEISNLSRLRRILPTLRELLSKGASITLISHLGRPKGTSSPACSLKPVFEALKSLLPEVPFHFSENYCTVMPLQAGEILILENLRFHPEEEENNMAFAKILSRFGDLYVNDAFSASHRAHASIEAITHLLPSYAGRLMQEELEMLEKTLEAPKRPLMAVVGGSKVSTKLALLLNLVQEVDFLAIGGAMANTFLKAKDFPVGASLVEDDLILTAQKILKEAEIQECQILLPLDVVVAKDLQSGTESRTIFLEKILPDDMILDVGPLGQSNIAEYMGRAKTLLWNGPLGVFEVPPFDQGTTAVAATAATLTREGHLISVAGGGDTVSALSHAHALEDFSYVSLAGGAFLEWLEGRDLPGVDALKRAAIQNVAARG